jgi:hypothetical protein
LVKEQKSSAGGVSAIQYEFCDEQGPAPLPGSLGSIVHYDYDGVRTVRASMVRYRTLITPVARLKHIEKVHHTKGHFSGLLLR